MKVVVATPACRGANSRRRQQREAHQQPQALTARSASTAAGVNLTKCLLTILRTLQQIQR